DESCSGGKRVVALAQERLLQSGGKATEQTWSIPLCPHGRDCSVVDKKTDTITAGGCGSPLFVNADGRGYYVSDYAADDRRALRSHLSELNAEERIALEGNEWLLMRSLHRHVSD